MKENTALYNFRSKFAPVENDVMLLATATIGAAAYFTDTNSLQMVGTLSVSI